MSDRPRTVAGSLFGLALAVLAVGVALNVTARLLLDAWPLLVAIAITMAAGWWWRRRWSRW